MCKQLGVCLAVLDIPRIITPAAYDGLNFLRFVSSSLDRPSDGLDV
ncbi:MAG: hypothetical protein NC319_04370 [Butyricicoccus sp.]|nr:hypothetical protein [Butyricicoccus sp.]